MTSKWQLSSFDIGKYLHVLDETGKVQGTYSPISWRNYLALMGIEHF